MFELITITHPRRKAVEAMIRLERRCDHGVRLAGVPGGLVADTDESGVIGSAARHAA